MPLPRKLNIRITAAGCCLILAAQCMRANRRNVQESLDWNLVLAIKLNDEAAVRRVRHNCCRRTQLMCEAIRTDIPNIGALE